MAQGWAKRGGLGRFAQRSLGVGAHLGLRSVKQLREMIDELGNRYQVTVAIGQSEREIADRMIHNRHAPQKLPLVWDRDPWRLI